MRKYTLAILALCALFFLVACNQEDVDGDMSQIDEFEIAPDLRASSEIEDLITMVLDINGSQIIETISNESDSYDVGVDRSFSLEIFYEGSWYVVPTTELFIFGIEDEGFEILAGYEHAFEYGLYIFSHPESGLFRLRHSVYLRDDNTDSEDWEWHDLVVEFVLD